MPKGVRILVVDDIEDNRTVLRDRLESQGYSVTTAVDGEDALEAVRRTPPDLVLLDVMMPRLDGIETVKRLKTAKASRPIPVILLTSKSDAPDVIAGLDAGADEYLVKPVDHGALVARVRAMLRMKSLQDQLREQSAELARRARDLAELNADLSARVARQVEELERVSRLKRFLAPQVAEAILSSSSGEEALRSHRADIAVVFCDLREFTSFAETAEPEDVIAVLSEYHQVVGELAFSLSGTLERFAGDGVMVIFNDPVPCSEPCDRATQLAVGIRTGIDGLIDRWRARGAHLGIGIGMSTGFATVGRVGFHRRFDYAAIGSVTNLAARLCDLAGPGEILVSERFAHRLKPNWQIKTIGSRALKGFAKPAEVFQVHGPAPA